MRWNSFRSAVCFAAAAAISLALWLPAASRELGRGDAIALFAAVSAALYLLGLGPSRKRNAIAALAVAGLGIALVSVGTAPAAVIIVVATGIGVARAGWLYRSAPLRGALVEGVLAVASLSLANAMAGPGTLAPALACWTFFLVQACFFLVAGSRARHADEEGKDPFERARADLVALLEERA